jgi:transcriptional regulator of aromatic amino acid metabolism
VNSIDLISISDIELLQALIGSERRPNLMVECGGVDADDVLRQFQLVCAAPAHSCRLPGALDLPAGGAGTLLLHDVAALTISQQVMLFDWLQHRRGDTQVVSVTNVRLMDLVRDGRFLEGLFYRLNLISVTAQRRRREFRESDV